MKENEMTETRKMKAAVLAGPQSVVVKEVPVPVPGADDIEIEVSACGVCGSDIHMWKAGRGWYREEIPDFVMGHEFCGVVTNPGTSRFRLGDRVVFWANLYCGECDMCRSGREQLCREVDGTNYMGFVSNGAYAERFVGRARNAYLLPDTVSDISAALIDPLMVAYHAVRESGIRLGDRVLVVGTGIIGLMIGELAKKAGAGYVALSKRSDRKLERARRAGYFDEYFDSNEPDMLEKMAAATKGGFDVCFEVVGSAATLDTCIRAVKPGGSILMIGNSTTKTIDVDINRVVLQEIRLIGSVSCTREEFEGTINLIARGTIDPEQYVTDVIPLEKLQNAFERQISRTDPILKAVVVPKMAAD